MAGYEYSITYNSVSLNVVSLTPTKRQKTIKQVIGKNLSQIPVVGVSEQQWELQISGKVYGTTATNIATNRGALEALDNVTSYPFVDGIHNGTYIMQPGSLSFSDVGEDVGNIYNYSMTLIEV